MKRKYYIHGIIILIMTILLAGCGAAESKKSSAKEQDVVVDVAVDPAVEWVSENIKSVEYSIPKEWECQENEDERIYYPLGKSNDKNYIKINYWRISVPTKEDNPTSTELENVFKDVIENNKVGRIKNWNEEKETYLGRPAMHASYIQRESAYEKYIVDWYAAMISDKEIASFQYVRREDQKDSYKLYFEKNTDSLVMHGINGFEQAEYQKFNSYASDNGLAGTRIYIEGTIYEVVEHDSYICFFLEQADGNRWAVISGSVPIHKKEKFEEFLNKKIKVFGIYEGFSDRYELPILLNVLREECYYEDEDGNIYTEREMRATNDEMIKWCVENGRDIFITDMKQVESNNIYSISGVVDSVLSSINYVYLYQDTEDGIKSFSMDLSNNYPGIAEIELNQINKGDAISICCYIMNDTPYVICVAEAPHIKWGLEDLKKQYTDKCNKFSYKDIARNPDNVKGEYAKLAGKVIQVIEDGNSVILRVNITPTKYGFYEDTIYVEYTRKSKDEDRILEDDVITIYGVLDGTKTYTATLGQSITIPKVRAEYIDIK